MLRRHTLLFSGLIALVAGIAIGVVVWLRGNAALGVDDEWMEEIVEHRSPIWEVPSYVFNFLGGGWFAWALPIALVVLLLVLRRPWTALYLGAASLASTLIVHALKVLFGRARPEQIMLHIDSGSFPSGHSANAATLAAVLVIVLWRTWVWFAGAAYVILMMLSRTYLGAHWSSDTVGGLLIGAAVAVILWVPLASRLLSERRPTH